MSTLLGVDNLYRDSDYSPRLHCEVYKIRTGNLLRRLWKFRVWAFSRMH